MKTSTAKNSSELDPSSIVAIIDTREQLPLDLDPLGTEVGTLETGDYSIKGLEHVVRIERKSLEDLLGCVGRDRERFDREVQRLNAYPVRVLVVESTWQDIESGLWQRSKVTPEAVIGSLLGWQASGYRCTWGKPCQSWEARRQDPLHGSQTALCRASIILCDWLRNRIRRDDQ